MQRERENGDHIDIYTSRVSRVITGACKGWLAEGIKRRLSGFESFVNVTFYKIIIYLFMCVRKY